MFSQYMQCVSNILLAKITIVRINVASSNVERKPHSLAIASDLNGPLSKDKAEKK